MISSEQNKAVRVQYLPGKEVIDNLELMGPPVNIIPHEDGDGILFLGQLNGLETVMEVTVEVTDEKPVT